MLEKCIEHDRGLKAIGEHLRRAGGEGAEHLHFKSRHVKQRRHAEDARVWAEFKMCRAQPRVVNEIAVRKHRSLRHSRGARRIEQQPDIFGSGFNQRERPCRIGQNSGKRLSWSRVRYRRERPRIVAAL